MERGGVEAPQDTRVSEGVDVLVEPVVVFLPPLIGVLGSTGVCFPRASVVGWCIQRIAACWETAAENGRLGRMVEPEAALGVPKRNNTQDDGCDCNDRVRCRSMDQRTTHNDEAKHYPLS